MEEDMIRTKLYRYKNIVMLEPIEPCDDTSLKIKSFYASNGVFISLTDMPWLHRDNIGFPNLAAHSTGIMAYTCISQKEAINMCERLKISLEEYNEWQRKKIGISQSTQYEQNDLTLMINDCWVIK